MRILLIGLIALISWSSLSTYIYVCKIRGFCNEQPSILIGPISSLEAVLPDTISNSLVLGKSITDQNENQVQSIPENLIIYFAFDKSDYSEDPKTRKYFTEANSILGKDSDFKMSITGHTDAIGSASYNQKLGNLRAQTMKLYFMKRGISSKRIVLESRGENEPIVENTSVSGRAKNRRAVITINK